MDMRSTAQPVSFNNEAANIAIQAGVYNNHGNTNVNLNQDDPIRRLPQATEAPFNAYTKQHEPTCLPHTREDILDQIYRWTDGQDEPCVYWLNGLAGTGKSTIARTVARRHHDLGNLGASFFFAKGGGDVGHAGKFVTTIAAQLAGRVPATREHIREVVERFNDISNLSLRDQWQQLVLRPLSGLRNSDGSTSLVFVIDALDECDDDSTIQTVIELLAEAQVLSEPKLHIFVTSRPEAAIRNRFRRMPDTLHRSFVLHNIPARIVNADIKLFLERGLATIGQQQDLPDGWHGPAIVTKMVNRASGLFIWAATAYRFIDSGRRFAAQRLNSIIEQDGDTPVEPEKHLDSIYLTVLQSSISPNYTAEETEDHCKMVRLTLGTLAVLQAPLTTRALGELLDVAKEGIGSIFQDLHAILDLPQDVNQPLRLHHPSMRDFVFNNNRCKDLNFWVDEAQANAFLATHCIRVMTRSFEQGDGIYARLRSTIPFDQASCSVTMELNYACVYWTRHLERSKIRPVDNGPVHVFLEKYLLDWLLQSARWATEVPMQQANLRCLENSVSANDAPRLYALLRGSGEKKFDVSLYKVPEPGFRLIDCVKVERSSSRPPLGPPLTMRLRSSSIRAPATEGTY